MATTLEQIIALAEQLSPEKQRAALRYVQKLAENEGILEPELPPGMSGKDFLELMDRIRMAMSPEDIELMTQAIMEDDGSIYLERP